MPVPHPLLLAALLAFLQPQPAAERTVRVAAAADLKLAFEEVASAFRKAHPDVEVSVTYGSSGNFFAQIQNGAPFDLFLSADLDYPRRLASAGLVTGTVFPYAKGRLAICVPASTPFSFRTHGFLVLRSPGIQKVAMANPRHAPYGRAAEEALKNAGLLDSLRDRLVLGENVEQAAQFVESWAVDAGLVAYSISLSPAMSLSTRCAPVPDSLYSPIVQGGAVLKGARDVAAAQVLRDFLVGKEGQAILAQRGFEPPGP